MDAWLKVMRLWHGVARAMAGGGRRGSSSGASRGDQGKWSDSGGFYIHDSRVRRASMVGCLSV